MVVNRLQGFFDESSYGVSRPPFAKKLIKAKQPPLEEEKMPENQSKKGLSLSDLPALGIIIGGLAIVGVLSCFKKLLSVSSNPNDKTKSIKTPNTPGDTPTPKTPVNRIPPEWLDSAESDFSFSLN